MNHPYDSPFCMMKSAIVYDHRLWQGCDTPSAPSASLRNRRYRGIREDFYDSIIKAGLQKRSPVSALVGYAEAERIPLPEKPSTTAIELNLNENLRRVDSNLPRRCNAFTAIQGAVESAERTVST